MELRAKLEPSEHIQEIMSAIWEIMSATSKSKGR